MAKLETGATAPAFTLPDQDGKPVKLSDYKGQRVIVYFYPADDTPGCTKEACQFNDNLKTFEKAGVVVLGISPDMAEKHVKFRTKYKLKFPLLTDADKKVMEKYGAWGKKTMYGKKTVGTIRSTFLVAQRQGRTGLVQRPGRRPHGQSARRSVCELTGRCRPGPSLRPWARPRGVRPRTALPGRGRPGIPGHHPPRWRPEAAPDAPAARRHRDVRLHRAFAQAARPTARRALALHSFPCDDNEDAFCATGTARLVDDPAVRADLTALFVSERSSIGVAAPSRRHSLRPPRRVQPADEDDRAR